MPEKTHQAVPARAPARASRGRAEATPLPGSHPDHQAIRSVLTEPYAAIPIVLGVSGPGIIRRQPRSLADLEDPDRFEEVNQALFAQSTSGTALQPFVNPTTGVPGSGTGAQITRQFIQNFRQFVAANPMSVAGSTPRNTTNANADADALTAQAQLTARFPFIPNPMSAPQLAQQVSVFNESIATGNPQFVRARLADKLFEFTDIGDFQIQRTDPRFEQILDDILADPFVAPRFPILAGRAGAFTETPTTGPRQIFLHEGLDSGQRMRTLMHEIAHFFAHADFQAWIAQSSGETFFNEGFTEFLARLAMTPAQLQARQTEGGNRQAPFEAIQDRVARFVSDDDLARAYFLGEVWRLEATSQISQQVFARDVGLAEGMPGPAEGAAEKRASATARGIVQEVIPGERYRFLNLDIGQSAERPEHLAGLRDILARHVAGQADARVEFVGFASAPGSIAFNRDLSLRRARDFYALARAEGVPAGQLVNESSPQHHGETRPTADDDTVHGRAFNRRVEMIITRAP